MANINLRCELITGLAYDGEEEVVDDVKAATDAPKKTIWHTQLIAIARIFGIILWGFSLDQRAIK